MTAKKAAKKADPATLDAEVTEKKNKPRATKASAAAVAADPETSTEPKKRGRKPKPAAPNLEVRVDAPTITMEDARPTAGGDVAGASALAPQELYKPGDEKTKGEVVTKAGAPIAREEMTREQKDSARRRAKPISREKKHGANKSTQLHRLSLTVYPSQLKQHCSSVRRNVSPC